MIGGGSHRTAANFFIGLLKKLLPGARCEDRPVLKRLVTCLLRLPPVCALNRNPCVLDCLETLFQCPVLRVLEACLCRIELSKMQNFDAKSLMY